MRLVIVSNRLPFSVSKKDGALVVKKSDGGLASGISSYLSSSDQKALWVGWPGLELTPKEEQQLARQKEYEVACVSIPENLASLYYNGFCNTTIWPLFHYVSGEVVYKNELWEAYKTVNELFYDALKKILQPGDIVLVQDYHLMLLPRLLGTSFPSIPIGFFLHIPFPSYDVLRMLPTEWQQELVGGMLGADLVGFHTYDYTQNFLQSAEKIFHHTHTWGTVVTPEKLIRVDTFPMGVNYDSFYLSDGNKEVARRVEELSVLYGGKKVILSLDRLDYTKGIENRLIGFEEFLVQNPAWQEHVQMVLVAMPSRIDIDSYRDAKKRLDELIGRINGRFSTLSWTPISYRYTSIPFEELAALYKVADVALITPLRDGMNLVAKEYVASRSNNDGVLVLSELAGASQELTDALIINPNNTQEIVDALFAALSMSTREQSARMKSLQSRVAEYSIFDWMDDMVQILISNKGKQEQFKNIWPRQKSLSMA